MGIKVSTSTLYIIAAASGTGKTSLTKALVQSLPNIKISISHTTRPKYPQEIADQSYFFVAEHTFRQMVAAQEFLEYAQVFGHYYGTSRVWVEEQLNQGYDVLLDIDWQGAAQIRKLHPRCESIFLLPPSPEELRRRLQQRKRDDVATIENRLNLASSEIAHYAEFDYIVINDNFEQALKDLQAIICANRLRQNRQAIEYATLLKKLITH